MACEEIGPLLSAALDDELTDDETRALEMHLQDCAGCRAKARALGALQSAFRAIEPSAEVPRTVRRAATSRPWRAGAFAWGVAASLVFARLSVDPAPTASPALRDAEFPAFAALPDSTGLNVVPEVEEKWMSL